MKKLIFLALLLPQVAFADTDINDATALGTAATNDFIVAGDSSAAAGSRLKKIVLDTNAANHLTGAGTLVATPTESSLAVDDLKTLSGVAGGEVDLSTFTGTTISDDGTIKDGLQDLETAVELKAPTAAATFTGTTTVANLVVTTSADLPSNVDLPDDTVDLADMTDNSVDSPQYVDSSIDTAHIEASQITNALMADNAIDSVELVAGSVDESHLNTTNANTAGYALTAGASNNFTWVELTGGAETNSLETTVTGVADTEIFVGDGADSGAFVALSGDVTMSNTGEVTVATDAIDTAMINTDSVTMDAIDADGNFTSLTGNWTTTGTVTAAGFTGALTGNVTGNASGTAATVTGAAQSAITSVGTLTTLTVDDMTLNGSTITGVSVGGMPDNIIDNGTMADSAIDTAELAADAVEGTKIADDQIDSEHYVAASIDNEHLADDAVGTAEIATDAVTMDSVDADGTFTSLTGNWLTTGTLQGAVSVVTTTDGTESPTAAQMYGSWFIADHATATSDTTYTLPTAVAGMSACFYDNGAGTGGISVDPAADDLIILDGTAMAVLEDLESPGVAGDGANGDFVCILAIDATNWITLGMSGTWVEETP